MFFKSGKLFIFIIINDKEDMSSSVHLTEIKITKHSSLLSYEQSNFNNFSKKKNLKAVFEIFYLYFRKISAAIKLPKNYECMNCMIRIVRSITEIGKNYSSLYSCADVNIVNGKYCTRNMHMHFVPAPKSYWSSNQSVPKNYLFHLPVNLIITISV